MELHSSLTFEQEHTPLTADDVANIIISQTRTFDISVIHEIKRCPFQQTFQLNNNLVARFPRNEWAVEQMRKEYEWLPQLQQDLSITLPRPLFFGQPSPLSHVPWLICQEAPGTLLNLNALDEQAERTLAIQLASCIQQLQAIDPRGGPTPGNHNCWIGEPLAQMKDEMLADLSFVYEDFENSAIDFEKALTMLHSTTRSTKGIAEKWIHGALDPHHLIMRDGMLTGITDFCCTAVGDAAYDVSSAWTFFSGRSRAVFKEQLALDTATWHRAHALALWTALNNLAGLENPTGKEAEPFVQLICDVLAE